MSRRYKKSPCSLRLQLYVYSSPLPLHLHFSVVCGPNRFGDLTESRFLPVTHDHRSPRDPLWDPEEVLTALPAPQVFATRTCVAH